MDNKFELRHGMYNLKWNFHGMADTGLLSLYYYIRNFCNLIGLEQSGAPNETIVQNHLNIVLLNVF